MGKKDTFWTLVGGAFIIMIPAIIMIYPYSHNISMWITLHTADFVSVMLNTLSITVCAYFLARTVIGIVANVFLPKIPMPKNKFLRIFLMASVGIIVGVISSVTALILWVITCLLGMITFSFVETHEEETV